MWVPQPVQVIRCSPSSRLGRTPFVNGKPLSYLREVLLRKNIREERELTGGPSVKRVALNCSALEGIIMLMQRV